MATKNISPLPSKYVTAGPPQYMPEGKYKKAKAPGGRFIVKATGESYTGPYIETYKKQYFAGETPQQNGVELEKLEPSSILSALGKKEFAFGASLLSLLQSAYKKKVSQDEANKGIAKRYFVQDNRNKKVSETSQELFEQGKKDLPDFVYTEVAWHITSPAEDVKVNGIKFQGSESRNKETIQNLEAQMPGISKFVTDYTYLVTPTPVNSSAEQPQVEMQNIKDSNTGQEDFRKAGFDKRK